MKRPVKASKRRQERVKEIEQLFDPKAARKWERDWQNELIDLEDKVEVNYNYAREIYMLQGASTKEAINRMVTMMSHMAGEPVFKFRGQTITTDLPRLRVIQERNFLWSAIRLLVACAEYDVQVADFKLSPSNCARCGKSTRPTKKEK